MKRWKRKNNIKETFVKIGFARFVHGKSKKRYVISRCDDGLFKTMKKATRLLSIVILKVTLTPYITIA